MKIQQFDGGLNVKLRPQFLQTNQGEVYTNIDSSVGSLSPVKDLLDTGIAIKPYHKYFNAKQEWLDSDVPRDWLEFQKKMYWTDRKTRPQKYDGTTQSNLGIVPPVAVEGIQAVHATTSPQGLSYTPKTNAGGNLPIQDTYYMVIEKSAVYSSATLVKIDGANPGTSSEVSKDLIELTYPPVKTPDPISYGRSVTISGWNRSSTILIYRMYNYTWYKVGQFASSGSLNDTVYDISANEELTFDVLPRLKGVYQYVATFYNINDDSESGPSPISGEIDIKDGGYTVFDTMPTTSDPQVTHLRLYRVGGNIAKFSLVVEVPITDTKFEDRRGDSDIIGTQLLTPYAAPAPVGLSFIQESYAMLFGAVDEYLRFTPIGKPDSWPELYFIQYDAPITGIAPVANGILVFTETKTHIVTGSGPTKLATFLLSGDQGCIAYESVGFVGTEAVWVSSDGVCRSSGNRPEVISKPFLGKASLHPLSSTVYDETYYVINNGGDTIALGDGIVKTFDFDITTVNVANDKLYAHKQGKLWEVFGADSPAKLAYKSAILTEGSFTKRKSYKKIFVYSSGHVIINVIIDGQVVQTKELNGEDNHTIQVPQNLQAGYYIQFQVTGTGEVYEIEYSAEGQS